MMMESDVTRAAVPDKSTGHDSTGHESNTHGPATPERDIPTGAGPMPAGRALILASAGSGKTYRLSSQLIGLLAAGVPPAEILASTFTRKAAGEIAERVLLRIAQAAKDPVEAARLQGSMPAEALRLHVTPEVWAPLLVRTVRSLHRLQVQTIDAFFHRVARSFAQELGLPGRWEVAEEPVRDRIREMAIDASFEEFDQEVLVELVRLSSQSDTDRSVHRLLSEAMASLHGLYLEIDPDVLDPWGFEGGEGLFAPVPQTEVASAIAFLEAAELPRNRDGSENATWRKARDRAVALATEGNWEAFLGGKGITEKLLGGSDVFSRHPIPEDIRAAYDTFFRAARAKLGLKYQRRMAALGRFIPEYDLRLRRLTRQEGKYGFDEITRIVAGGTGFGRNEELYYRLDGAVRHILLDEFQDTSTQQWAALEPLVEEILSGHEGERAALIVADPKQSIYGWRGGEPRILDWVAERFGLVPESVPENWRSSSVVLDFVNRVFDGVREAPELAGGGEVVTEWMTSFESHVAMKALPGYVRVEVGPPEDASSRARIRPNLLRRAVDVVGETRKAVPGATIGVLTRTNRTAAWLIAALRRAGIEASEEGGVPVADSEPVLAILALLRLADHPGDRISAYLAARTPVGRLVGLAPDEWQDVRRVDDVARGIREALLRSGYGEVISGWVRELTPLASPRDRNRMRLLAELAFRWDPRATLRPVDFVRHAETAAVEDPGAAAVRVMTVNRAKGLEFDVVVLPELDGLEMGREPDDPFLPLRRAGGGPVVRVFPRMPVAHRSLFPEVGPAATQARDRAQRDALSLLYVALTRARHATHILLRPDPSSGPSTARTGGVLLKRVLGGADASGAGSGDASGTGSGTRSGDSGAPRGGDGDARSVLFESGDAEWWRRDEWPASARAPVPPGTHERVPPVISLSAPTGRRLLPRRAPSELEGGGKSDLRSILRPGGRAAMEEGALIHAWLEQVEWVEGDLPERDELLALAATVAPGVKPETEWLDRFREWIDCPAIRALLSREAFPPGTRAEREVPFVVRDEGVLLQGFADRVVRIPDPEGDRILVIDWKTDRVQPSDRAAFDTRVAFYLPQLAAYVRAFSRLEGLPAERVEGVLAFLRSGTVIPLPRSSA